MESRIPATQFSDRPDGQHIFPDSPEWGSVPRTHRSMSSMTVNPRSGSRPVPFTLTHPARDRTLVLSLASMFIRNVRSCTSVIRLLPDMSTSRHLDLGTSR
jgi:hypothetical protein